MQKPKLDLFKFSEINFFVQNFQAVSFIQKRLFCFIFALVNVKVMKNFGGLIFFLCTSVSCNFLELQENSNSLVKFDRFDKQLLLFDEKQFEVSDAKMKKEYGDIYSFYIEELLGIGQTKNPDSLHYYKEFFPQFFKGEYKSMMDTIKSRLDNKIPEAEKSLSASYKILKKEFPNKKTTKLYSFFISPNGANPSPAFSYSDSIIGINLFNYLGKDFVFYKGLFEGYNYMIEWNQPGYITRNVILVEYSLLNTNTSIYNEVIYNMIEEGKKMYFLDKVCENMPDETKIGYSKKQLEWCRENEYNIWTFFIENKLLYSIDVMDVKRYTEEGPTTPGMSGESPGKVGAFIGWQIVRKFMDKKNITLQEMMLYSPKEIFKLANYKPSK